MKRNILKYIVIFVSIMFLVGCGNNTGSGIIDGNSKIKIVKNEVSNIKLEEYSSDVFSMKKPVGWKVETGGEGIYYAIRVYDEADTRNQIFLMPKMQPMLKSDTAKKQWVYYNSLSGGQHRLFAEAVVLNKATTEEFYKQFNNVASFMKNIDNSFSSITFPTFTNFTKLDESDSSASMKSVALDSKVLRATFNSEKGEPAEGMFLASIVNFGNNYQMGIDTSYYMIYDIMTITSAKDQFIDYKDMLLECINSIKFTDSYVNKTIDDGNTQTKNALALSASIQKSFDSYMSAWENRSKTYDIMSQKQSDATLGYERVYNTKTNEIYKAYNGFTDDYDGKRYQSITDDMYALKTSGYIEKR